MSLYIIIIPPISLYIIVPSIHYLNSKQKDSGLFFSTYHPFTSFVIFDKSQFSCVRTMPISADEFCDLLTSYGVKYKENKA